MKFLSRIRWVVIAVTTALLCLALGPCRYGYGTPLLQFRSPLAWQLSAPGDVRVELRASRFLSDVEVQVDGIQVDPAALVPVPGGFETVIPGLAEGFHTLVAKGTFGNGTATASIHAMSVFELFSVFRPGQCENLMAAHCLTPWPSTALMEEVGDATETGYRLKLPFIFLSGVAGPPLDPAPVNEFDGFSIGAQVLMHFPAGVDLEASGAATLRAPGCCGQSSATPYVGVRTQDGRSVEHDSPTVLLDTVTGERVLHWVELDANAEGNPGRQLLILRPSKMLKAGRRYIVAVRNLVDPLGAKVGAEPVFRNLKFQHPTTIPEVETRREHFEGIFAELHQAGIPRWNLIAAFDFVTRSHDQLTSRLPDLRDDAFSYIDSIAPDDRSGVEVTDVLAYGDCSDPSQRIWRRVGGTFEFPYYLTGDTDNFGSLTFPNDAPDGTPVRNGTHAYPFDIAVPCSVKRGEEVGHPLMLGHGLFGTGRQMVEGYADGGAVVGAGDTPYVAFATDWIGLSGGQFGTDALYLATQVIGFPGPNRFNNFPTFPARLHTGQLNHLVLSKMMHTGFFNRMPIFWADLSDPTSGVLPVGEIGSYFGVSLGGIHGGVVAAVDPYTERYQLDVPGVNFAFLIERSTQFELFLNLLRGVGLTDPMETELVFQALQEIWTPADPSAFVSNVTGLVDPPLSGVPPKKVLVTGAWLDKQVSNQSTEIMVRSMGIPSLQGSLQAELEEIPDVDAGAEGIDNGFAMYATGWYDVFDPAYDAVIPLLANRIPNGICDPHGIPRLTIPAGIQQQAEFLRPGGKIKNFCTDTCDGQTPDEQPAFFCDPLN